MTSAKWIPALFLLFAARDAYSLPRSDCHQLEGLAGEICDIDPGPFPTEISNGAHSDWIGEDDIDEGGPTGPMSFDHGLDRGRSPTDGPGSGGGGGSITTTAQAVRRASELRFGKGATFAGAPTDKFGRTRPRKFRDALCQKDQGSSQCHDYVSPPDGQSAPPPLTNNIADKRRPCTNRYSGSIIECENQTLGEDIPVAGTSMHLHYQSDRVAGRKASYRLAIPLYSGTALPPLLRRIELRITVGDRVVTETFRGTLRSNAPGKRPPPVYYYAWDRRATEFATRSQHAEAASVSVSYIYPSKFDPPPGQRQKILNRVLFPADDEVAQSSQWSGKLGVWQAWLYGTGFGSWTLDVHHAFEPATNTLYYGDGREQFVSNPKLVGGGAIYAIPSQDGQQIFYFDLNGRHTATADALTGVNLFVFRYGLHGHPVAIVDQNGREVHIEDATSPSFLVGPDGDVTRFEYDTMEVTAVANALQRWEARSSDGRLLTALADPRGGGSSFEWDGCDGRLTKDHNPAGGFMQLDRAARDSGFAVTLRTAMGQSSLHELQENSDGSNLRTLTDSGGLSTVTSYSSDGSWASHAPNGTMTVTKMADDPRYGGQVQYPASTTVTTLGGRSYTVNHDVQATLTNPDDPLTLQTLVEQESAFGLSTTNSYDAATGWFTQSSPLGRQTRTHLGSGRVDEIDVPGQAAIRFSYDPAGRLISSRQKDHETTFTYDGAGRLASTSIGGASVAFLRDALSRITGITRPGGAQSSYAYDNAGNATSITPPSRPAHLFEWTPLSTPWNYLAPDVGGASSKLAETYDLDGTLLSIAFPNGLYLVPQYDAAGRLIDYSTPALGDSTAAYLPLNDYDPGTGALTNIRTFEGENLRFTLDDSTLASVTWSGAVSGSVGVQLDARLRPGSLTVDGDTIAIGYDDDNLLTQVGALSLSRDAASGRLTQATLGAATTRAVYDPDYGFITDEITSYGGGPIFSYHVDRNAVGQITARRDSDERGVSHSFTYQYDADGRLTQVSRDGAPSASYSYDANGNRSGAGLRVDSQDRLLSDASFTYSYNDSGSLVGKVDGAGAASSYVYSALGLLVRANIPGHTVEYVLDGLGRRVDKKLDGTLTQGFLYLSGIQPVAELDGSGALVSRFVYGMNPHVPDYFTRGGKQYRIVTDLIGSPRVVVDISDGSIVQRLDYDAFGNLIADSNPGFQPFGFAGAIYDRDTRLTHFEAREYDPASGRFTTKDPLLFEGGGTNVYGYANNDPVDYLDPVGRWPLWAGTKFSVSLGAGPVEMTWSSKFATGDMSLGLYLRDFKLENAFTFSDTLYFDLGEHSGSPGLIDEMMHFSNWNPKIGIPIKKLPVTVNFQSGDDGHLYLGVGLSVATGPKKNKPGASPYKAGGWKVIKFNPSNWIIDSPAEGFIPDPYCAEGYCAKSAYEWGRRFGLHWGDANWNCYQGNGTDLQSRP